MTESSLESLVYVSSAVRLLSPAEIEYLLKRARERNQEHGITGLLLYIGGNFMQYIEGPADHLDTVYQIIVDDPQHTGIILISREPIAQRQFGDWSMAYHTRDTEGYSGSPAERRILVQGPDFSDDNPSSARIVLHSFWNRGGS